MILINLRGFFLLSFWRSIYNAIISVILLILSYIQKKKPALFSEKMTQPTLGF